MSVVGSVRYECACIDSKVERVNDVVCLIVCVIIYIYNICVSIVG